MESPARTAGDRLAEHRPSGPVEAADVARTLAVVDSSPDPWSRRLPLHLTASALVVHPPSGGVLLRWHRTMGRWLQIGGHGDPGEVDPVDVVLREGREETGLVDLRPWPNADLAHVVVVPVPETPREPAHEHADLRFVLATDEPRRARPERPDAPLRWLTLPDALELVAEDNLRETLTRVRRLIDDGRGSR